eukprot:2871314-Amphidinium_carterae.2
MQATSSMHTSTMWSVPSPKELTMQVSLFPLALQALPVLYTYGVAIGHAVARVHHQGCVNDRDTHCHQHGHRQSVLRVPLTLSKQTHNCKLPTNQAHSISCGAM